MFREKLNCEIAR